MGTYESDGHMTRQTSRHTRFQGSIPSNIQSVQGTGTKDWAMQ